MSLFGGSKAPATQTTTTSTEPSELARPFVEQVFGEAQNLFQQGPLSFFPGQTVAGPTPTELEARQQLLSLAGGGLPQFLGQGTQALTGALNPLDVTQDPTTIGLANAATEPLFQQFTERVLPQVGSAAVGAGAFGGSRQQILEQGLTRDLFRTAGDVRAGVFGDAQARQLEQQKAALALFPQFAGLQSLPAQITGQVGAAERADIQAGIGGERERFEFGQLAPLTNLQNFSNFINQFGGGITTGTGPSGLTGGGGLSGALAGGLLGGQLGGFFPGASIGGFSGGGLGALGGLGLGLLGFL